MIEAVISIVGFLICAAGAFYAGSALYASQTSENERVKQNASTGMKTGIVILVVGLAVFIAPMFIVQVDAGNVGVMKTFGIVDDKILQPGLHIKNPVTEVIPISTRTLKYMDYGKSDVAMITALSNDGLTTTMGIAITYHVNPKKVQDLYKTVGTDYEGVIMVNPIHSVPRDMISKYDTKTLYSASKEGSSDRAKLERELFSTIQDRINEIGVTDSIIIEQASIRNIDFDQKYKDSISTKMETDTAIQTKVKEVAIAEAEAKKAVATAEGEANAMRVRAQGRADAARIEAEGTKDAMRTIGEDNYAAILFIQTMKDNPRAIYLPNDGSIPIIKNVDATASA